MTVSVKELMDDFDMGLEDAYLKYYLETYPVELTPFEENPYYRLQLKRTDAKQEYCQICIHFSN